MESKVNTNLDRYKSDFASLLKKGEKLHLAMQLECFPAEVKRRVKKLYGDKAQEIIGELPSFNETYQSWYSEAKVLIKQLLPDRLPDFIRYYEKPKLRKDITFENYRIEDYLQGVTITRGYERQKIVGPEAAIPHFRQQIAILNSLRSRFKSSLFDIRQLVQADIFDTELDAAKELIKHKFTRAGGVLSGVVLERHLRQVCDNHSVKIAKKTPTVADLNNALKEADIIDIPQWRFIQHLADIRNLCAHDKDVEPTTEQVNDLVSGVAKIVKTIF